MRLWHYRLISHLPRQQLIGQHRECCALRGDGWGKPHSVVNYVFIHPYGMLYNYHMLVVDEMMGRGYNIDYKWFDASYRGKTIGYQTDSFTKPINLLYPEHNEQYLQECLLNLKNKGIEICVQ